MAYIMRFRGAMFLVNPPSGTDDNADPEAGTMQELFVTGDLTNATPTGPVYYSLAQICAKLFSVNNRMQSGLHTNVRFEVYGVPFGSPETGPDLSADQKKERRYVVADTPNPALLIAIHNANKKAVVHSSARPQWTPNDNVPEVSQEQVAIGAGQEPDA